MDSVYRYQGQFSYTTAKSHRHGDLARITIEASLFPPRISVAIHDGRFNTVHSLANTRFDFKSRDSPRDLRSRDSWSSDWVDCFRGIARLVTPRIDSVPTQINMLIYASWGPAFVVLEFAILDDYCQFATRTRPGSSGRWIRSGPLPIHEPPKMPKTLAPTTTRSESSPDDSSTATATIEAPSSASTDTHDSHDRADSMVSAPGDPIHVNFARTVTTLNNAWWINGICWGGEKSSGESWIMSQIEVGVGHRQLGATAESAIVNQFLILEC